MREAQARGGTPHGSPHTATHASAAVSRARRPGQAGAAVDEDHPLRRCPPRPSTRFRRPTRGFVGALLGVDGTATPTCSVTCGATPTRTNRQHTRTPRPSTLAHATAPTLSD